MSIENLFGEGHELNTLQQEVGEHAQPEETEDNLLFTVAIASVMYCPAAIASVAFAC